MGEYRDRTPSILGYNPGKKGKPAGMVECPYCWFCARSNNILSRHINQEHWERKEADERTKTSKPM